MAWDLCVPRAGWGCSTKPRLAPRFATFELCCLGAHFASLRLSVLAGPYQVEALEHILGLMS